MAVAMVEQEWLTVAQAARRLQVHPETVRTWIREGRLRASLLGSERAGYRIAASEVERLLRGEAGGR